jgi:hypothetical protein
LLKIQLHHYKSQIFNNINADIYHGHNGISFPTVETFIGVRAEARRPYGMKSDFVNGRQQLLEPFSRSL